jgi:hypothetical protein
MKMSKNNYFILYKMKQLIFSLLITLLVGCKLNQKPDCICTMEFRMITVEITDSLNNPLTKLETRTIDQFGRTIIPLYKKLDYQPNRYVIADDSNIPLLSATPISVVFIVTDSVKSKNYFYTLNTDECKCHINKLDGPTKIIF